MSFQLYSILLVGYLDIFHESGLCFMSCNFHYTDSWNSGQKCVGSKDRLAVWLVTKLYFELFLYS